MRNLIIPLAGLALTGCASGIDGVWAMYLPYSPEEACVDTLTHNFTGATEIGAEEEEDDGWTSSETDEQSDEMMFVQIETTGSDTAVLVIGAQSWPGTKTGKGLWTFEWIGSEDSSTSESHETGYEYVASTTGTSTETIALALDGGLGSGSWDASTVIDQEWTESDGWSDELSFRTGRIPSSMYLEREADGGGPGGGGKGDKGGKGPGGPTPDDTEPATNERDASDCDSDTCRLLLSTECSMGYNLTMTQTDYDSEEVFDYLRGVGQDYGAN